MTDANRPEADRPEADPPEGTKWEDPRPQSFLAPRIVRARANPGRWLRLTDDSIDGLGLMPWYGPLFSDSDFETQVDYLNPSDGLFSARHVYARAKVTP